MYTVVTQSSCKYYRFLLLLIRSCLVLRTSIMFAFSLAAESSPSAAHCKITVLCMFLSCSNLKSLLLLLSLDIHAVTIQKPSPL